MFKPLALALPPGVAALVGDSSQSFSVEGSACSSAGITLLVLIAHFQRFIFSCLFLLRLQRQHVRCSAPILPYSIRALTPCVFIFGSRRVGVDKKLAVCAIPPQRGGSKSSCSLLYFVTLFACPPSAATVFNCISSAAAGAELSRNLVENAFVLVLLSLSAGSGVNCTVDSGNR